LSTTSPYRTSSDLVIEALANLRVLSAGNPIDPEDFNWVNEKLDSIYRKLGGLEICYVPDPNNIPGAWFSDLADIVAGECASKFGLVGQEFIDKVNKGLGGAPGTNVEVGAGAAAKSLKIITRGRPTYEPLRFVNY
jgi:hypothetical protein